MQYQCNRQSAIQNLKGLAAHQLELVHQRDLGRDDQQQILSTVTIFTPGIDPVVRRQQWSSFVAAYEVIRDLQNGFYDTSPVLAYANAETSDPLCPTDRVAVHNAAVDDMAEAVDRLLTPRHLVLVAAS